MKSIKVLISHQSYFIQHCPCHTRFSCFRVTHYLCSCCPRNYFSQNCMKDRNRQYKKYQHIDEDRKNLNHSQVPLSLVFIFTHFLFGWFRTLFLKNPKSQNFRKIFERLNFFRKFWFFGFLRNKVWNQPLHASQMQTKW